MTLSPSLQKPVKYLFGLLILVALAGCTGAEHHNAGELNVQDEEFGPDHSLYRHHDIMLGGDKESIFGVVDDGARELRPDR